MMEKIKRIGPDGNGWQADGSTDYTAESLWILDWLLA
jgi:hypothetical protein